MLLYPPQTPQGALGAALSALIVVLSLAGLTMHGDFYAGIRRRDYWVYYTNQSNLLVFVYFALLSPALYGEKSLQPLIPHAEYALMLCIMLTHLVFHHFLAPYIAQETAYTPHAPNPRIAHADSVVQHYVVPLLTFAYWLLCSAGKARLSVADAFIWLLFPAGYVAYVLIRARLCGRIHRTKSAYPYPFLDVGLFGLRRTAKYCAMMSVLGVGAALCGVLAVHAALMLKNALF